MYLLLYCKGSKRVTQGFTVKGSWRPNRTAIYWPPTLMAISVVSFLFSRAAQPEAQGLSSLLDDGFLYCILSLTCLVPKLHRGSRGPLLLGGGFPYHVLSQTPLAPTRLLSNSSDLQLNWGPWGPPLLGGGFLYHTLLQILWSPTHWLPVYTELYNSSIAHSIFGMAYLIVIMRKYLSCSTEFTLFRCISLWVYHWIFYLVPFRQPSPPTRFPLITAIGMCHFLPVYHFGMACLAGSNVNIQRHVNRKSHACSLLNDTLFSFKRRQGLPLSWWWRKAISHSTGGCGFI